MYERVRLVHKIITDRVNQEFIEKRDSIIHDYENYKGSKNRIRENRNMKPQPTEIGKEETEEDIKKAVVRHRIAILIGISITRYRSKLDWNTYEDLVRVFLGLKGFFFFTFDKLIHTTNKAFQTLANDEYVKSRSFKLFKKYSLMRDHQKEKLYLNDYKSNLGEMSSLSGLTARLLFSPKSKILCIHFFTINKPYTNNILMEELNYYKESYVSLGGEQQELYSGDMPLPHSKVFLKRNKKKVMEGEVESMIIEQNMVTQFSKNSLKLKYQANSTDVVLRVSLFFVS
jgi:hypothetical protein